MGDVLHPVPQPLKDRKTGLVVFGVLQICFGSLSALLAFFTLVSTVLMGSANPEMVAAGVEPGMMLMGGLVYGLVATWFLTMGIGSILARRWARSLTLVTAWIWLLAGLSGMVFMFFFLGDMYESMESAGQVPPGFARIMNMMVLVFMVVFYVAIPGSLLLFYRLPSVKATCERRNPTPSWTDACPLPVLAHALLFTGYAFSMVFVSGYDWTIPFFGQILSGATGAMVAIPTAVAFLGLAWGVFHLKAPAWWGSIVFTVIWSTSALFTFSRVSMMEFYEHTGMPEQQLAAMRQMLDGGEFERMMVVGIALWAIGLVGLMIYTRRYYDFGNGGTVPAD